MKGMLIRWRTEDACDHDSSWIENKHLYCFHIMDIVSILFNAIETRDHSLQCNCNMRPLTIAFAWIATTRWEWIDNNQNETDRSKRMKRSCYSFWSYCDPIHRWMKNRNNHTHNPPFQTQTISPSMRMHNMISTIDYSSLLMMIHENQIWDISDPLYYYPYWNSMSLWPIFWLVSSLFYQRDDSVLGNGSATVTSLIRSVVLSVHWLSCIRCVIEWII